jgi:N-acetylglucosaminyl-diphospho-decaprenol L-rhamnosyltransferase
MSISVVIISFKSDHLLQNIITSIPNHFEIIIIENSLNTKTKNDLENKFSNTKVIIPETNLGYAGGVNLGIKKSKYNFTLVLVADVDVSLKMLLNMEKCVKNFDQFALVAPVYENPTIHKNFKIFDKSIINKIQVKNFKLTEVDEIDGACFLVNKNEFKDHEILDDNFFLYFESTDLCHRLKLTKKKMYIVEDLKFMHIGLASSEEKYAFEILVNRNWHYCWSKFYFFKKNYSYLYALRKLSPNLLKSLIAYFKSKITLDSKNARLNKANISGILNAILLKKSSYRPNIS